MLEKLVPKFYFIFILKFEIAKEMVMEKY